MGVEGRTASLSKFSLISFHPVGLGRENGRLAQGCEVRGGIIHVLCSLKGIPVFTIPPLLQIISVYFC